MPRSLLVAHALPLGLLIALCLLDSTIHRVIITGLLLVTWAALQQDYGRWVRWDALDELAFRRRLEQALLQPYQQDTDDEPGH